MKYSVFTSPPNGFEATVQVSACYLACQGKLLFLKRHPDRPQGTTWGVPAGKLEVGETPKEAVIREIYEEIGVDISKDVREIGTLYVKLPHLCYVYHLFQMRYAHYPELKLALNEHTESVWVTIQEAECLPLITAGKEALAYYQKNSQ